VAKLDPNGRQNFGRVNLRRSTGLTLKDWKGIAYVAKRQPPRGRPKTKLHKAWVENFKWLACWTKQPDVYAHHRARHLADEYNKTTDEPGNLGKWYYRDILMSALMGKLILGEDEKRITTPTVLLHRSTNQTMVHDVDAAIVPDTKDWDNNVFWSATVNPSRILFRTPGLYLVGAYIHWTTFQTNARWNSIRQNGTKSLAFDASRPGANWDMQSTLMAIMYFHKDDYIEVVGNCQTTNTPAKLESFYAVAITPETLLPD